MQSLVELEAAISAALNNTAIQIINNALLSERGIVLSVLREDANHASISGNKLRKLKYNLLEARKQSKNTLLTFGGAYSNHIAATAAAGKLFGFDTIGIIRGEELEASVNETLKQAKDNGMQLYFLSRSEYRQRNDQTYLSELQSQYPAAYIIPEGGSNQLGVKGCTEILGSNTLLHSHIALACGTGATMAGVIQSLQPYQSALGFSALKGNFMKKSVSSFLPNELLDKEDNWEVCIQFHRGAYAKIDEELIGFIGQFHKEHNILLDPVYTGKAMMGLYALIQENYFPTGSKILFIHTGGLQGWNGFSTAYRSLFN